MCWSLPVSAGMVAFGGGASVMARRRGAPKAVWVALAYFALIEALQAAAYLVVDACGSPANRAVTLLSFLHIAFQPAFINAISLELIPAEISRRIRFGVFFVCGLSSAFMLAQLMPFEWAGTCRVPEAMCGATLCSRSGDWHIAWEIPYNGLGSWVGNLVGANFGLPSYMLAVFVMPFLYGSWRFTLFDLLLGPVFTNALTSNNNEAPAIWCLFSVGIVALAFSPPLMDRFRVTSWPLWPKRWTGVVASRSPASRRRDLV
jgi:energy-converting hydrogenase Eha subunit C